MSCRRRAGYRQPLFEPLELRLLCARLTGIDVSQFQGTMNWTTAKNQGISFALIRASRTDTVPDTKVSVNVPAAKAAGLQVGVYHRVLPFSTTTDSGAFVDPVTDANNFISSGGAYMTAGYLQPVVDVENGFGLNTTPVNGYDLSKWVLTFVNRVKAVTGVTPLIYGSSSHLSATTSSTSNVIAAAPTLWVANWTTTTYGDPVTGSGSPPTSPWSTWRFWQYADDGVGSTYGASSARIDLDVFNGTTAAQLAALVLEPEATVTQGTSGITDGSSSINVGTITNGGTTASATFTVRNDGDTIMHLSGLTVPTGFTVTNGLVSTLLPGATDDITVRLDNSVSGVKSGQLSFTTDDPNENPFNFTISGTVNPKAPTNFSITSTTNTSVSMQWTDNSDETSFLIERKTGAGGTYAQIGTTAANATTYTDSNASPGTTYFYRVRDTVSSTVNSAYATEVSTTTLANVPTGVAASDGTTNSAVHVTWSASTGASSYAVFRNSTNNSATATQIGTTTNLFYDDSAVAGDTVAYYWVKALNSASQPSGFSSSDSGYRDTIAPSTSSALYNNDALPQKIVIKFSENVMPSLASADVSVQDQNDLAKPAFSPTAWSYDSATNTATFTFGAQLIDSYYRATIAAGNVRDGANNAMASDMTVDFVQLAADGNHNHSVEIQDFNILAANFGKSGQTFSQGNYDYSADGAVGITDFNLLASNFGRSISAPAGTQSLSKSAGTTTVIAQPTSPTKDETSTSSSLLEDAGLL